MRARLLSLAMLAGCGRLGFDAAVAPDATHDSVALTYAETVLGDMPRAYYRLDDEGGPAARNEILTALDAVLVTDGGLLALGESGALPGNSAIRFSAEGNLGGPRISAWARTDEGWPTFLGDFTVELFVRALSFPPQGWNDAILVCESYLVNGFRTGWGPDGALVMWSTQGNSVGDVFSAPIVTLQTWHHVVFVRRGANAEIFLDGQLVASGGFDLNVPDADSECGFGAFHGMPSDGHLDEVALYDRALTPAQIAAHVAAARP